MDRKGRGVYLVVRKSERRVERIEENRGAMASLRYGSLVTAAVDDSKEKENVCYTTANERRVPRSDGVPGPGPHAPRG